MRRAVRSVGVVVSIALFAGVAPTSAEARTPQELNVCWVNKAPRDFLDLEIVVDGPSFKTASLDDGDCVPWDVRPGQYKITVEDLDEMRDGMQASCPVSRVQNWSLKVTVKRQQDLYKAGFRDLRNGGLTTTVRKDRRTTITFVLTCVTT